MTTTNEAGLMVEAKSERKGCPAVAMCRACAARREAMVGRPIRWVPAAAHVKRCSVCAARAAFAVAA